MTQITPRDLYDLAAEVTMALARELAEATGLFEDQPVYFLVWGAILLAVWIRLS